jgi:hypothetical protein
VPVPFTLNARSIGIRNKSSLARGLAFARHSTSELVKAGTCAAGAAYDWWRCQRGIIEKREEISSHQVHPFTVNEIAFGDGNNDLWNSQ